MARLITAAVLVAAAVAAAGCGTKTVKITGTVTHGGEKLTWPNGGTLRLIYFPKDRDRNPNVYSARTDTAASTYAIDAIPPGTYTVAVQQFDPKHMDALGGRFDPSKTTIEKEVTADGQVIDIDIPK